MLKKILIGFGLLLLAACAAMLPPLTPTQTAWATRQWPGVSEEEIISDRELYVTRCSSCHSVVLPERHSMEKWEVMVSSMAVRAKITPDQKGRILRYLATAKTAP